MTSPVYSHKSIVATILECQFLNLNSKSTLNPTKNDLYQIVNGIKALQIDTLQMVKRSHYIVMWSRTGNYNDAYLDNLCYSDNRQLFEYWYHAACIIPVSEYPYRLPIMEQYRHGFRGSGNKWARQKQNQEVIDAVLDKVGKSGKVKSSDFENTSNRKGTWWNWKPAKRALEHLYNSGDLAVSNRVNFNKVYGLTRDVIPDKIIDKRPITNYEETCLHDLHEALKATGVATPKQLANYTHMKQTHAKPLLEILMRSEQVITLTGEDFHGSKIDLLVHQDNLSILERAADGDLSADNTTLLSPFDNLFWAKNRDSALFGFEQILECYKPEPLRRWGYFCLPILHQGKLIGRIDPKLDRKTNTLELKKTHMEDRYKPDENTIFALRESILDFMEFHNAVNINIRIEGDGELAAKLSKSL